MKSKGAAALIAVFVLASASTAFAQSFVYSQAFGPGYARGMSGGDGASRESFGG